MRHREGFILPAVVIASVIMLALLSASVYLTITSSNALKDQYYNQLAKEAAEAGSVRMAECLRLKFFDTSKVVTPASDCEGNGGGGYVIQNGSIRTTYEAKYVSQGAVKNSIILGKTELLRGSDSAVYKTYNYRQKQQISREIDIAASRASKRWWYFGRNAKLDFGASGVIPGVSLPTPGKIGGAASSHNNREGTTTISDRSGNILFYSDGRAVWLGDGTLVPDNTGGATNHSPNCNLSPGVINLISPQDICGTHTATQAVISFPVNKEETKYIIISNTVKNGGWRQGTLYATMVQIDPANPSNSAKLLYKNIRLGHHTSGWSSLNYADEALNARFNSVGNGVIAYAFGHNGLKTVFYAFPVYSNDNGANIQSPAPTIYNYTHSSASDLPTCVIKGSSESAGFGSINFNHDNTKMIVYMGGFHGCSGSRINRRAGQLFLFDISGGDTSMNLIARWRVSPQSSNDGTRGYSADFSPSGRYVYASTLYPGELYRYDISSGSATTIKNSERFIGYTNCRLMHPSRCTGSYWAGVKDWLGRPADGGGQVLRGPDNRMYVANRSSRYISYIDNPDAPSGAKVARPVSPSTVTPTAANIGWHYGSLRLSSGSYSFYGLPQMVTLYSPKITNY